MENSIVIAGVDITTDDQGRFNINALHRASGLGSVKAPSQWLRTRQAKELLDEITDMQICTSPISSIKGGKHQGTFAHELIAISYAGWISPGFQLKVNQAFLDLKSGNLQPAPQEQLSKKDLALMVIQSEEEKEALVHQVEELTPKAQFHDRVTQCEGAISLAKAAKILGTGRNRLISRLRTMGWLTRRNEPYQAKIEAGYVDVKLGSWEHPDHGLQQSVTTLITGKGLAKLQKLMAEKKSA